MADSSKKVGTYNPLLKKDDPTRVTLNEERIKYWLGHGATPSDRVGRFLGAANIIPMPAQRNNPIKGKPGAKAVERVKEAEEAAAAKKAEAEEAAKAPPPAPEPEAEPEVADSAAAPEKETAEQAQRQKKRLPSRRQRQKQRLPTRRQRQKKKLPSRRQRQRRRQKPPLNRRPHRRKRQPQSRSQRQNQSQRKRPSRNQRQRRTLRPRPPGLTLPPRLPRMTPERARQKRIRSGTKPCRTKCSKCVWEW